MVLPVQQDQSGMMWLGLGVALLLLLLIALLIAWYYRRRYNRLKREHVPTVQYSTVVASSGKGKVTSCFLYVSCLVGRALSIETYVFKLTYIVRNNSISKALLAWNNRSYTHQYAYKRCIHKVSSMFSCDN